MLLSSFYVNLVFCQFISLNFHIIPDWFLWCLPGAKTTTGLTPENFWKSYIFPDESSSPSRSVPIKSHQVVPSSSPIKSVPITALRQGVEVTNWVKKLNKIGVIGLLHFYKGILSSHVTFSMFRRIRLVVQEKKTYIDTKSDDKESVLLFLHQNLVLVCSSL